MTNKLCIIPLLLFCLLLTGCYDIKEIDETAYIVALGVDPGNNGNFSYTFQFSSPLAITKSSETSEDSGNSEGSTSDTNTTVTNLTISAPDFYAARNLTTNFMSKNIDMSHLKMIVFSSRINTEALENHSQLLLREREVRPHTSIAVAATTAADFLEKVNPELESNTSKYYELMTLRSNNIYAPTKRLHDFVDELTSTTCTTVLPIATNGKAIKNSNPRPYPKGWIGTHTSSINSENSILCGMAIFKNQKLSGTMDGDSAMIYNILNKNIDTCTVTIKSKHNSNQTLSFRIVIPQKAEFSISLKNHHIKADQSLQPEFLGSVLPEGYSSFDELYSHLRHMITNRVSEFFSVAYHQKSADILGLQNCIRSGFSTWKNWKDFDWEGFCAKSRFTVNINFI